MEITTRDNVASLLDKVKPYLAWTIVFSIFYMVGSFIPVGFDWRIFFSQGSLPSIWTPWTAVVIRLLNFPLLVALTLFAVVFRTYQNSKSPLPVFLAVLSLPTLWVLILGNLDGLVLIGLVVLPWGVPLVLMKPQLAAFVLLAKKSYLIFGLLWLIVSVIIWGPWPLHFLVVLEPDWNAEWVQDITLFPWGILLAIPLLWFSRGDEDLLMAAGSFATPHLFPYHFLILMPALGRMSRRWMVICWIISWSPLLANWLGTAAWHFGNLFVLLLWWGVYRNRDRKQGEQIATATPEPSLS